MKKLKEIKEKFVGEKLKTILTLDINQENIEAFKKITGNDYGEKIDDIKIMIFENKKYLAFVDFDSDGYRSGEWHVVDLKNWLDKGATKGIKHINSVLNDMVYVEDNKNRTYLLITTDAYIIRMGQDNTDSYYPSNFFENEDIKKAVVGRLLDGDVVGLS